MKRKKPQLTLVLLFVASLLIGQTTGNQEDRKAKNQTSIQLQVSQVKFKGYLNQAKSAESVSAAKSKLQEASTVCNSEKIEGCEAALKKDVKLVFDKWLVKYTNEEKSSVVKDGLESLKSNFCGTWKDLLDCSEIDTKLASFGDLDYEKEYEELIAEGKAAKSWKAKAKAFEKAKAICEDHLASACKQEIKILLRTAHYEAFQDEIQKIRSDYDSYRDKKEGLATLEDILDAEYLGDNEEGQYKRVFKQVHEGEIRRLIDLPGSLDRKREHYQEAIEINKEYLDGALTATIEEAEVERVDEELEDLLERRRGRGDRGEFRNYMDRIDQAERLITDLPVWARTERRSRLADFKDDVVQYEFQQRQSALNQTTDWRETLNGFEGLMRFADRYQDNLDRRVTQRLIRDRQTFMMTEYEARIQQSLGFLAQGQLAESQLALTGAVELSNTGFLPEGPAKYRHREVYQKLYDEHHRRLQLAKGSRDWNTAYQSIELIGNLFQDAPFILARASVEEELVLVDVSKFESQLQDASGPIRRQPLNEQYAYFNSIMDAYQQLKPHLNNTHRQELGRVAYDLSKQPMDEARDAIQINNYGRAIGALAGLSQFLHQPGYRSVLPARPYDEMGQLIDHSVDRQINVFGGVVGNIRNADQERRTLDELSSFTSALNNLSGWKNYNQAVNKVKPLYSQLLISKKDRLIEDMRAGNFNYRPALDEMSGLQKSRSNFISAALLDEIGAELEFYSYYEVAKSALRRAAYQESIDNFQEAKTLINQLPNSQRGETAGLIENGLRMSLEGLLNKKIEQDKYLGKSSQKSAYRSILAMRLQYQDIPLTLGAEKSLSDLEFDWFGGACRANYRAYNLGIVKAEAAVEAKDFAQAVAEYQAASKLEPGIGRCMLDIDKAADQARFYSLAQDFNDRKAKLDDLYNSRRWENFDAEYTALWNDYQKFDIKNKFGYSFEPMHNFVLDKKSPDLLAHFIRTRSTEDEALDWVAEALRVLSFRSNAKQMEQLGREVARSVYPIFPAKKYKQSFSYFLPQGEVDKCFKKFEKGYKSQWKVSYKQSR